MAERWRRATVAFAPGDGSAFASCVIRRQNGVHLLELTCRTDADSGERAKDALTLRSADLCSVVSRAQETELVAFGIGQDDPRLFTLSDIDRVSAESQEARKFVFLVTADGVQIDVKSVLRGLVLRYVGEHERRELSRWVADLDAVIICSRKLPPKHRHPKRGERLGIAYVDHEFSESCSHKQQTAAWPDQARAPTAVRRSISDEPEIQVRRVSASFGHDSEPIESPSLRRRHAVDCRKPIASPTKSAA